MWGQLMCLKYVTFNLNMGASSGAGLVGCYRVMPPKSQANVFCREPIRSLPNRMMGHRGTNEILSVPVY